MISPYLLMLTLFSPRCHAITPSHCLTNPPFPALPLWPHSIPSTLPCSSLSQRSFWQSSLVFLSPFDPLASTLARSCSRSHPLFWVLSVPAARTRRSKGDLEDGTRWEDSKSNDISSNLYLNCFLFWGEGGGVAQNNWQIKFQPWRIFCPKTC